MPPEAPLPQVELTKNEARESASAGAARAGVTGASAEPARLPTFAAEVRSIEHASLRPSQFVHGSPSTFLAVPLPAELGLQHASAGRQS
jgi:hypothetical protein